jgi:pimeloyl-ACP methyl ester carboxylesterase
LNDTRNLMIPGPVGNLSVRTKGMAASPANVIIMVQGSNLTGQSIFDFSFEGGDRYSLMDEIVAMGFGAITFSLRGYGKSELPGDPFDVTTEAAMEDLEAVADWLSSQGYACPHLFAFSWGGRIAGRWAENNAARINKLILYDPARGGGGLVLPAPTEPWFTNTPEFYLQKFEPEFTALDLRTALAAHVLAYDSRSPNGIRRENATPVIAVRPEAITNPTLMVYGSEAAKAIYMIGGMARGEFFEKLATNDKAFVIVPGAGDFAHFQEGRFRLYQAIANFLA